MKNILLLGLICCGILMSCYKDKGNYDYTVLPEVSIENLEDFYNKSQLDSIVLEPEMVTADGAYDENDWTYLWRLYPGKNVMDTIGYERVLRYQFTEEPGSYNIYFTAINKRTEVKYSKDIEINLSGVYMDGWMVLYEEDGKSKTEISRYHYQESEPITIEKFASMIELHVDHYENTCDIGKENSLHLEIEATDLDGKITTYKIPLTLSDHCN